MCSSSYQRLNSASNSASMSVQTISNPVPRVLAIAVLLFPESPMPLVLAHVYGNLSRALSAAHRDCGRATLMQRLLRLNSAARRWAAAHPARLQTNLDIPGRYRRTSTKKQPLAAAGSLPRAARDDRQLRARRGSRGINP